MISGALNQGLFCSKEMGNEIPRTNVLTNELTNSRTHMQTKSQLLKSITPMRLIVTSRTLIWAGFSINLMSVGIFDNSAVDKR